MIDHVTVILLAVITMFSLFNRGLRVETWLCVFHLFFFSCLLALSRNYENITLLEVDFMSTLLIQSVFIAGLCRFASGMKRNNYVDLYVVICWASIMNNVMGALIYAYFDQYYYSTLIIGYNLFNYSLMIGSIYALIRIVFDGGIVFTRVTDARHF